MSPIILRAKKVIKCIDEFIKTYEFQWLKEAKGMGYEKQIIRLGGLKERFRFLIDILNKYQNKEIDKIDELNNSKIEILTSWDNFDAFKSDMDLMRKIQQDLITDSEKMGDGYLVSLDKLR